MMKTKRTIFIFAMIGIAGWGVLLFSTPIHAAIAFDAASNSTGDGGDPLTWSHTVTSSGSNRVLIVGVSWRNSGASTSTVSSVNYNGDAMTLVRKDEKFDSESRSTALYELANPDTGSSYTITVDFSGAVYQAIGGAMSFTGVDQTTPTEDDGGVAGGTGNGPTVTVTSTSDNAWAVDTLIIRNDDDGNTSVGADQTASWNASTSGSNDINGAGSREGPVSPAGDITMSWSVGNNSGHSISAAVLKPSASADSTAPASVTDLAISGAPSSTSVSLTWTAPGDDGGSGTASVYDIRYSTSTITAGNWSSATQVTGEPTPSVAGSSESFTVTGLDPETTYYFAIKTRDEVPNISALSNVPNGTTIEDTPPADITDLATGTVTSSTIDLSWTAPGDDGSSGTATTYDIRYSTSAITAGNWASATQVTGEPGPSVAGTGESHTVTGLAQNTTYYFAIKTADEVPNTSALSNSPSGTTDADVTAPDAVSDLATGTVANTTIDLSWTAPGDDAASGTATSYDIRYRTDAAITTGNWATATLVTGEPSPSVAGTAESHTVTGLAAGTIYYFAIKTGDEVVNWSGLSNSPSGTTDTVDVTAPAAIIDLATSGSPTQSSITITWTAPGDDGSAGIATTYDVRYSTSTITEGNWGSATQATGEPSPQIAGSTEYFTVTGLSDATTYYFAIKTADEVPNTGALSNVANNTTTAGICTVDPNGTYIEAENYNVFGNTFSSQTGDGNGNAYLQGTVTDTSWGPSGTSTDYTLDFNQTGTFYLWIRGNDGSSSSQNSLYYGLNGSAVGNATTPGTNSNWNWVNVPHNTGPNPLAITIGSTGPNTINIWSREANFKFDGFYLTTSSGDTPTGGIPSGAKELDPTSCSVPGDSTAPNAVTLATGTVTASSVQLSWTAPGDDGASGTASAYDIRYSTSTITAGNWASATQTTGEPGPSVAGTSESFTVTGLGAGTTYYFAIKTRDEVPNISSLSNVVNTTTYSLPVGGYTADNVIPAAQVNQSGNGDGLITINWRGKDAQTHNVTLETFEYSVDGGTIWNAPTSGDASGSLSTDWNDNGGGGYSTATDWTGPVHNFTFDTDHTDATGMAGVDQSDIQIRFTLNDGSVDSAVPVTSVSFRVDNAPPTATITSAGYSPVTDTMTITGTGFLTIAAATTDVKAYVDWTKLVWDVNGDDATTADITFVVGDVTSLTVTDDTTLTLVFTAAKATAIEATTDYGSVGGADTLDVTAGFSRDDFGNAATTDGASNAPLTIVAPQLTIVKSSSVISDPINGGTDPLRIPGAVVEYSVIVTNNGDGSPDEDTVVVTDP
ncbi:MAG: hypothetical protein GY708_23120, partial [Actinomycetia bacterium]|nr:hypothetical protein [Actinomycetes bacterium]